MSNGLTLRHATAQAAKLRSRKGKEQRNVLDNPVFDINNPATWEEFWGKSASDKKALQFSPIYRCCELLADTVGKLPCVVYRRVEQGKEPATDHPAYSLLKYSWNEEQTAITALGNTIYARLFWGNSYTLIVRDAQFRPVELIPLAPQNTYPVRANNMLHYVTHVGASLVRLRADEVIHLRSPVGDGLVGYSIAELAANAFSSGASATEFTAKFFSNDASGGIIIQYPHALSEDKLRALKTGWDNVHQGVGKSHRTAILENGATISRMAITAKDAMLIESLKWSAVDAANYFGVPPHKVGVTDRAAYNTLEQENQSFLSDTIDPLLVAFEQQARMKLLTEAEKRADSHVIEFTRAALLRADLATRTAAYATATGGRPWMSPDEVRARENMNTVGGAQSEIIDPTNNFAPGDEPAPDPEPDADTRSTEIQALAERVMDRAKAKMVRRLTLDWQRDRNAFWSNVEYKHAQIIADELAAPAEMLRAITGEADPAGRIKDEIIHEMRNLK